MAGLLCQKFDIAPAGKHRDGKPVLPRFKDAQRAPPYGAGAAHDGYTPWKRQGGERTDISHDQAKNGQMAAAAA